MVVVRFRLSYHSTDMTTQHIPHATRLVNGVVAKPSSSRWAAGALSADPSDAKTIDETTKRAGYNEESYI